MIMMILWKEGWLSENEYLPSRARELNHLMRHVVKKRLEEWHLIVPSELFQCYPLSRIYEDLAAHQGVSRPRTKVEFGARNKRAEAVVVCGVPNGREHKP